MKCFFFLNTLSDDDDESHESEVATLLFASVALRRHFPTEDISH